MKKTKWVLKVGFVAGLWLCLVSVCPLIAADERSEKPAEIPESSAVAPSAPEEPVPEIVPPPSTVTKAERTTEGSYYLDFKGASLINVLNILSNLSGISFIAGTEVSDRRVSMTLDNVSLEDVLQSLDYGCNVSYDFIPGRNIYLFRAKSDAADKPTLLTRVFKLYYVRVSPLQEIEASGGSSGGSSSGSSSGGSGGGGLQTFQAAKAVGNTESTLLQAVSKILSDRGKVSVDDRSNSLIVTDSEDRLKMIEAAITELDRPVQQVLINVILVETTDDLARNLGVNWSGTFGTLTGSIADTEWPFRTSAPVNDGGFKDVAGSFGNFFKDTAKQFDFTNVNSANISTQGTRDFSGLTVTLQALENDGRVKVLAKPKILVLDNQAAVIKISTNQAIGSSTVTTGGGSGTTSSNIERYEVGTILRVTPLINTGGHITLTLEPSFATVKKSEITVAAGSETGDPTTRTARTTLMVNDGQTIALGGMLFSQQSNNDQKVPFFGNIPVVGKALFTYNEKSIKDKELVLFVTPFIISDPSMLEEPKPPTQKLDFEKEIAPFWKVKEKRWYKEIKDGVEPKTDFDGYFNVRRKLIDSTLSTLDQTSKMSGSSQS